MSATVYASLEGIPWRYTFSFSDQSLNIELLKQNCSTFKVFIGRSLVHLNWIGWGKIADIAGPADKIFTASASPKFTIHLPCSRLKPNIPSFPVKNCPPFEPGKLWRLGGPNRLLEYLHYYQRIPYLPVNIYLVSVGLQCQVGRGLKNDCSSEIR